MSEYAIVAPEDFDESVFRLIGASVQSLYKNRKRMDAGHCKE